MFEFNEINKRETFKIVPEDQNVPVPNRELVDSFNYHLLGEKCLGRIKLNWTAIKRPTETCEYLRF